MENWVKLRHACSPLEMFIRLRHGAEEDVKARNELRKEGDQFLFKVVSDNGTFAVSRESNRGAAWVDFTHTESGITVKDPTGKTIQETTLTLTDEGECKLRLPNGEELTCWQFRKRILEDLFFNLSFPVLKPKQTTIATPLP